MRTLHPWRVNRIDVVENGSVTEVFVEELARNIVKITRDFVVER